jgi:hypothetical protein
MPSGVHPKELAGQVDRMRQVAGDRPAVVVYAAPHDREALDSYARLGVERVLFYLPTRPEDQTLSTLDELAEAASAYR